jgi:UDP-galactopyranose mutase
LRPDAIVVCLSHLRWDFVLQRPQHLMGRFARERTGDLLGRASVHFVEPWVDQRTCPRTGVVVATPMIADDVTGADRVTRSWSAC